MTRKELNAKAKALGIQGYSKMSQERLQDEIVLKSLERLKSLAKAERERQHAQLREAIDARIEDAGLSCHTGDWQFRALWKVAARYAIARDMHDTHSIPAYDVEPFLADLWEALRSLP